MTTHPLTLSPNAARPHRWVRVWRLLQPLTPWVSSWQCSSSKHAATRPAAAAAATHCSMAAVAFPNRCTLCSGHRRHRLAARPALRPSPSHRAPTRSRTRAGYSTTACLVFLAARLDLCQGWLRASLTSVAIIMDFQISAAAAALCSTARCGPAQVAYSAPRPTLLLLPAGAPAHQMAAGW